VKYSKTLERFLSAHEGKLIEFEDSIIVLNIVDRDLQEGH
jgi:hypothetical protein